MLFLAKVGMAALTQINEASRSDPRLPARRRGCTTCEVAERESGEGGREGTVYREASPMRHQSHEAASMANPQAPADAFSSSDRSIENAARLI
jgi:hypothetical protein